MGLIVHTTQVFLNKIVVLAGFDVILSWLLLIGSFARMLRDLYWIPITKWDRNSLIVLGTIFCRYILQFTFAIMMAFSAKAYYRMRGSSIRNCRLWQQWSMGFILYSTAAIIYVVVAQTVYEERVILILAFTNILFRIVGISIVDKFLRLPRISIDLVT